MKRSIVISLAALLITSSVGVNFASAQFGTLGQPPVRSRPTVSPLINQGARGGINAFNYYGIIKPQFDTNRSINQLQSGMQVLNSDGSLQGALNQGQANMLGGMQTGHPATFLNYGHYFPLSAGSTTGSASTPNFGNNIGGANSGVRPFYGSSLNTFAR